MKKFASSSTRRINENSLQKYFNALVLFFDFGGEVLDTYVQPLSCLVHFRDGCAQSLEDRLKAVELSLCHLQNGIHEFKNAMRYAQTEQKIKIAK